MGEDLAGNTAPDGSAVKDKSEGCAQAINSHAAISAPDAQAARWVINLICRVVTRTKKPRHDAMTGLWYFPSLRLALSQRGN